MQLLSNGILNHHWSDLKKKVSDIISQKHQVCVDIDYTYVKQQWQRDHTKALRIYFGGEYRRWSFFPSFYVLFFSVFWDIFCIILSFGQCLEIASLIFSIIVAVGAI